MLTEVNITAVEPFADGASFGATGAYERVHGTFKGALDPSDARNKAIVNIERAPRDATGRVEYDGRSFGLKVHVFPEDIERAVATVDGVRAGNVIALGVEGYKGKESVVVVAEVRVDGDQLDRVRAEVHHRTLDVCGIPPRDVMLVVPGSLPKTSSGKLQSAKCKEQYLDEALVLA